MLEKNHSALKEWAVVVEHLAAGKQIILLRKGGILERRDGFTLEHTEFFLFPTYTHQNKAELIAPAHEVLESTIRSQPKPGTVPIQYYAIVQDLFKVTVLEKLKMLEPFHILSWDAVQSRFNYRNKPGLHVLLLGVHALPKPLPIRDTMSYQGCTSWVELEEGLPTSGSRPILPDEGFSEQAKLVRNILST